MSPRMNTLLLVINLAVLCAVVVNQYRVVRRQNEILDQQTKIEAMNAATGKLLDRLPHP